MSNTDRVRIYDLARELNLENRDVLNVCEQLNIAVKSHSSTIPEPEAERIRAAAPQYIAERPPAPARAVVASPPSPHRGPVSPADQNHASMPQKPEKKPQIVSVKVQDRPTAAVSPSAPPHRPAPPKLIAPKSATSEVEEAPTPSPPPARPNPSAPRPIAPQAVRQREGSPPSTSPRPTKPADVASRPPAKPPASAPPARPSGDGKAPVGGARLPERPAAAKLSGPPTRPGRPVPGGGPAKPGAPAKPTIVELRRPKPSRPDDEAAVPVGTGGEALRQPPQRPAEGTTDGESSTDSYESKLNRPTLNRPPKRGKDWDEEERARERAAKEKGKAKQQRRTQLEIDEDDDEFDEILEDDLEATAADAQPAAAQVNLSIARPPKPKHLQTQKPVTPPPKPAAKKPQSRQPQRDRREKEEKPERPEIIEINQSLTVTELAKLLMIPETDVVKRLFVRGIAVSITQSLDVQTAMAVAEEVGVMVETGTKVSAARKVTEMVEASDKESLQRRPPVVTIMGHVDHGKTTLLDSIRKTKVAQGEAGGITQHIGAYHVDVEHEGKPRQIVFLDTPGHEAFTAMRARGTRVTDIAILVVAADDGVQPQTLEALSHARAAEVPIIVAINKIDKEGANPDRVKQELSDRGLVPEEWGGDTVMVPVSALRGENLDTLLEMILLVSEVEELSANPDRPARGTVIEANLDRARGPVATLLVQNGTLRVGDILLAGPVMGKVRAMIGDRGDRVDAALPSFAVEVLGLSEVPAAGDEFEVYPSEKEARSVGSDRSDVQRQNRLQQAMASRRVTLTSLSGKAQEGELKELNLLLKADVQGSIEAIIGSLEQLPQNEVQVRVLLAAPGEVSETDIDLAAASSAVVVGFNTTLATGARRAADEAGIDVREYNVIYKLLDDIQAAMEGMLDPEEVEEPLGQAEVRGVFPVGRGTVAGCYILQGKVVRDSRIRVRRSGQVVFEGRLDSLKRFKEDTKEVNSGYECGINSDNFNEWQMGDVIEAYKLVAKRRSLSGT